MSAMVVKTERVTVIATTTFTPPEWMQLAFNGRKIDAIKALRDNVARRNHDGLLLGLGQAKDIVESVLAGITVHNERV